jgi:hypothetical protein
MFKMPLLKKMKQLLMLELNQMPRAVTQSQMAESAATETDCD